MAIPIDPPTNTKPSVTPLSAAEVVKHPAYNTVEWDLKPDQSGKCAVARGRSGGPFNLWYEVHGTGDVKVIWIMGLGAFRTAWKRQTKHFGHTHGTTYSSLVFDNRGMGLSDKPTCRYSTTEMAKDVLDLLTHLGWLDLSSPSPQRNLNIAGISMGGMIAQELGLTIPQHIQSLCLVSTAPRLVRTVPFVENLRQRINMFIPRDIDVQLREVGDRLFSNEFLSGPDTENSNPQLNFPTVRDRFAAGEIQKRKDTEGFTRKGFTLQAIAAGWHYKSPAQIKELGDVVGRNRIAVLHGTLDRMITFPHAEIFQRELGTEAGGVEYKIWKGCGHVPVWEQEDDFNRTVEGVIRRTGGL